MTDETSSGQHTTLNSTQKPGSLRDKPLRERKPETTRKLQVLSVGSLVLGIFEDEIATIAEWRRPSPLPQAPAAVLGIVSIEGRILTVLDPLYLFDETIMRLGFPPGLLVALRGDEQIALAIETRGETLDLAMKEIQPPSDPTNKAVAGIFHHGDHLVKVIEVKGLFQAALRGRERRRRRF